MSLIPLFSQCLRCLRMYWLRGADPVEINPSKRLCPQIRPDPNVGMQNKNGFDAYPFGIIGPGEIKTACPFDQLRYIDVEGQNYSSTEW